MTHNNLRTAAVAMLLLTALVSVVPSDALIRPQVPAATAQFSIWADGHCWRYYQGSGYLVDGYGQASAGLYTSGLVVSGTLGASATSTGATPSSDNGAVDGVLITSDSASAHASGTSQSLTHSETAGASIRASSPFPGLPSYVGASMAFSCGTDSSVGYDITKSCNMTYTLDPVALRWSRTSGSAGTCTVIGG